MAHSPPLSYASCPDCTWQIVAVIGRVDRVCINAPVEMDKSGMYKRGVDIAGPLCRCARCGFEFYVADGQVHKWLADIGATREPKRGETFTNGAPTTRDVLDLEAILTQQRTSLGDLRPPPD